MNTFIHEHTIMQKLITQNELIYGNIKSFFLKHHLVLSYF